MNRTQKQIGSWCSSCNRGGACATLGMPLKVALPQVQRRPAIHLTYQPSTWGTQGVGSPFDFQRENGGLGQLTIEQGWATMVPLQPVDFKFPEFPSPLRPMDFQFPESPSQLCWSVIAHSLRAGVSKPWQLFRLVDFNYADWRILRTEIHTSSRGCG